MVHAGFRQHGVVFNLGFTQRRNVVRDENEFGFPGAKGFEDRFVPKLFLIREKKKNTNDENTLLCERRKKKRERERERPRKNSIIRRVVNLKKGRHTKSQIFWFWTLEEREREIASKSNTHIRTVYFPDRMTTCKRLLMPSCVFFDESFDILKRVLFDVCIYKLAFLSSDAANFFQL